MYCTWFHGLAVRTLDSESSNPSSNLGGTLLFLIISELNTFGLSLFILSEVSRTKKYFAKWKIKENKSILAYYLDELNKKYYISEQI